MSSLRHSRAVSGLRSSVFSSGGLANHAPLHRLGEERAQGGRCRRNLRCRVRSAGREPHRQASRRVMTKTEKILVHVQGGSCSMCRNRGRQIGNVGSYFLSSRKRPRTRTDDEIHFGCHCPGGRRLGRSHGRARSRAGSTNVHGSIFHEVGQRPRHIRAAGSGRTL